MSSDQKLAKVAKTLANLAHSLASDQGDYGKGAGKSRAQYHNNKNILAISTQPQTTQHILQQLPQLQKTPKATPRTTR